MDPFEKAAQGVAGGFDDAAAQVVNDQSSGLRNTLYGALLSNPDVSARATKLGRQTGLAPELVERNLPEVERSTRLDQLDALPKENPFLAAWLTDPANARIAHDDIDTLDIISKSSLLRTPAVPQLSESYGFSRASRDLRANQQKSESAFRQYVGRNMPASEIFGRERSLSEGITEPFMRGLARGRRGLTLLMGMGGLYDGADAELAVRLGQQNRQAEAYPIPENVQAGHQAIGEAEGFGEAAWAILSHPGAVKETVIESMGVSAPSLLAAGGLSVFGPGGTAAGAGLGSFAVEYGATIQEVIAANGVNASDPLAIHAALNDPNIMAAAREKALARGLPIGMFDALTAGFAGKLLAGAKNATGSAGLRTAGELGIQAGGGGTGEAIAQLATDEWKPGEILLEAIAELPTGLVEIPANFQHARDKASRAETNAKAIEEINSFAQSAKVLQRDPETFQTFIAAAAEDGPVQNVFIDGRTLMQSGMAPSIASLSPAVREQLDRAILTGGMIAIPVDEYAARIAPTEFAPQLLDHLKTDAEGFSRTEAADFMANQGAELQAEVERVIGAQSDADTFRASQDVVKDDILGQLNTAARFTPQVNEAYATLVAARTAVRAAGMGLTPEAFHQKYGMNARGAEVAGDKFDQAGKLVTDTPEFANWFGESKVKDADGKPLVVYHGTRVDFESFDAKKQGTSGQGSGEPAFFFEGSPENADRYAAGGGGANTIPSYVSLKNPLIVERGNTKYGYDGSYNRVSFSNFIDDALEQGNDGVVFRDVSDRGARSTQYAVFDPTQIKSAIGNRGTFDPADPNILNQSATLQPGGNNNGQAGRRPDVRPGPAEQELDTTVAGEPAAEGWAGATRIRGKSGEPVTVYRGAAVPLDPGHFAAESLGSASGNPSSGLGVWFTTGRDEAASYGNVEPARLDIRNPKVIKVDELPGFDSVAAAIAFRENLRGEGHDGIVITGRHLGKQESHIVAFEPQQVVRQERVLNQPAYHGSPFKFDKFSLDHMGNGEGAQAYGWGLYFAGNKEVAEFYRKALAGRYAGNSLTDSMDAVLLDGKPLLEQFSIEADRKLVDLAKESDSFGAYFHADERRARWEQLAADDTYPHKSYAAEKAAAWAGLSKALESEQKLSHKSIGQLYEVNIPADGEFLLWDKPLNAQPKKVQKALAAWVKEQGGFIEQDGRGELASGASGEKIYRKITSEQRGDEAASKYLNGLGIAGIKYLDGSSRDMSGTKWKEGADPSQYDRLAKGVAENYLKERGDVQDAIRRLNADAVASGAKQYADAAKALESGDLVQDLNHNYVIFDDNAVKIMQTYYQPDGGATTPRGSFSPTTNTITLLQNADLSTFLHESAHYFFESDIQLASELVGKAEPTPGEQQIVDDVSRLLTWHGINGDVTEQLRTWHTMDFEEQRSHHERTAESFEAYLFSGQAPSLELQPMFQRFRAWMVNVYKSIKDFLVKNPEAGKLNDEVRSVFDRMIATQEQIHLAEQARSLTALFASPETSGMTADAFAAYQALGTDATNTAIEQLQAKGLRDMQWLTNARGREIKKLQKESKAARAEVTMEARGAVMRQPVYRAWDFLTRKLSDNDKLPPLERKSDPDVLDPTLDSLFVAIAKLGGIRKDQVLSEWGADPKDIPQSGLFGKPVWRVTEGLPIDSMASALAEHGYLPLNEHGQYELNDLGDRFLAELSGDTQYSHAYQPQDLLPGEQIANPDGLMAGRIEFAGLAAIGIPEEIAAHLKTLKMTATDGLHPDLVATLFEFSSGDELVRTLAAAPTPKDAINALAERMMLERFGELSSPDAIERSADQAIHNDVRARMLTTEVNALAQATGRPKILASAAKAFAADMIARLKVRDVRPGQYANAEARAAKAAAKAKGDIATAAAEKRNQVIQHYATRAAYDAQDEVKAGLRYLKKFDKRSKTIDPEYQDQIEAMLERFELRALSNKAVDRRASLAKWIEAQRESGLEPDIDPKLENEAFRTSYKNITVEEFRGLVDAVKQIEHLGRLKNKLLTAQDQRAFKAIVEEVAASIVDNGGKARKVELETPKGIRPWLEGVFAGHRKIASLIRQMDGLQDGGAFWRVLVRGMNEAGTNEAVMIEQATVKLAELYKPMLELKGGLNGDLRSIPEIGDSLTRGGRLSVALNWGNAANRQRVLDGDQWSEHQVHAILKTLTRAEWAFVQNTWAFIDSYWPQIEAKEKRVTGRAPDKVAAEPFSYMVDGEMMSLTGGYYPIKYDSNRDDKAEKHDAAAVAQDMMRGAMTRSTTRRGHTKERMAAVNRPVKKTLDVITQHVSEVTHDLAWHEWLVDANRLLDAKPINQAIRDYYGTEVLRTMKDALVSIATADIIPQDVIDRALLYLRANVSRSTMGFSLTTAFLQPFGLLQSMVRIGTKPVLRGMARWAGDAARFESSMTWIAEKSDFMRLRSKTFNRELHEIKGRVSHGHSRARQMYDASLFMLMQKMQMVADVPTWIGAYEKALGENHDDATAVAMADQSVLDSQGGGQTKDMAAFQRKHPFMTMFYSYFSTTMNLAAESTAATNFRNPLALAGWMSDMALLMVIPALGPAMILAMMKGEECGDPEECAVKLARVQAGYLMNLMLGVRELSGLTSGYDYSGPPVGRVVTQLERAGTQAGQGEMDEAAAMSAISLLGVSLGIPTTQILRSYRGWKAWEDGEAPVTSILMGPPPKD